MAASRMYQKKRGANIQIELKFVREFFQMGPYPTAAMDYGRPYSPLRPLARTD